MTPVWPAAMEASATAPRAALPTAVTVTARLSWKVALLTVVLPTERVLVAPTRTLPRSKEAATLATA